MGPCVETLGTYFMCLWLDGFFFVLLNGAILLGVSVLEVRVVHVAYPEELERRGMWQVWRRT